MTDNKDIWWCSKYSICDKNKPCSFWCEDVEPVFTVKEKMEKIVKDFQEACPHFAKYRDDGKCYLCGKIVDPVIRYGNSCHSIPDGYHM